MLALIISVCLKTDPATCNQQILDWVPAVSVAECRLSGQPQVDAYIKDHPDLSLQDYTCMPARNRASG